MTPDPLRNLNTQGVTMMEILVALGIFVAATAIIYQFIVQGFRTQNIGLDQSTSITEAQRGIQIMVREAREAQAADTGSYAVELADDNELIFYSDIDADNQTERVRFWLDGTDFKKGTIEPSGDPLTYVLADEVTSIISRFVRNSDTATPVFTYFNGAWPGDAINNPLTTPANPVDVKFIDIALRINVVPGRAPTDFELSSNIHLRNLKENL